MMAFWWRCLVGLSSTIFQTTWALCFRNICVLCSWVLNTLGPFIGGINPFRLGDYNGKTQSPCLRHCKELPSEAGLFPLGSSAFQNPSLGVLFMWPVGSSSGVVWSSTLVVFVLGPFGWGSGIGCTHILCTICLGLLVWSYHTVCVCIYQTWVYMGGANLCKGWLL